jgi:hypothetical protein
MRASIGIKEPPGSVSLARYGVRWMEGPSFERTLMFAYFTRTTPRGMR